ANFSRNFGIDRMLDFQKLSCWHQSKTRTASSNSMPSLSNSNRASVRHLAEMVGGLSVLRATWSRRRVQSASTSSLGGSADAGSFADEEDCSPLTLLPCSPITRPESPATPADFPRLPPEDPPLASLALAPDMAFPLVTSKISPSSGSG